MSDTTRTLIKRGFTQLRIHRGLLIVGSSTLLLGFGLSLVVAKPDTKGAKSPVQASSYLVTDHVSVEHIKDLPSFFSPYTRYSVRGSVWGIYPHSSSFQQLDDKAYIVALYNPQDSYNSFEATGASNPLGEPLPVSEDVYQKIKQLNGNPLLETSFDTDSKGNVIDATVQSVILKN